MSRFENPAGICFPPFLHYAERRILPKPARKRDVPKSQIIATGSTGAIGGHYRFIVHLLSVQARMREDAVRAI